jgi:hypothetical protein
VLSRVILGGINFGRGNFGLSSLKQFCGLPTRGAASRAGLRIVNEHWAMVQRRASGRAFSRVKHLLTLAAPLAAPEEAFHYRDLVQPAQNEKRARQVDHEIYTAQTIEFRPWDAAANEIYRKRDAQNR